MMITAPDSVNGKRRVYQETFRSSEKESKRAAEELFDALRASHPMSDGWIQWDYDIVENPNGSFQLLVLQAQYA